jgi:hypothetical protein
MKAVVITLALAVAFLLPDLAQSNVSGGTGKLGFQLRDYGAIRVYTPVYGGVRQVDRMHLGVALDSTHVFDEEEDANTVDAASLTTGGVADTIASVLTDNSFSSLPPNITVRTTVYAWKNDDFFIVKCVVKNIHTSAYPLYPGMFVIPKPSNVYGGETVAYDATKKISYFFRTGETPYIGVMQLSGNPYSFHSLDWDVYSSDPNAEASTDSIRYRITALPGFDAPLVAGADGSVFNLNAGVRAVAPGDSTTIYYAVMYGTSLAELQTTSDAATTRYKGVFTYVQPVSGATPTEFALLQNYPNPFNPSTKIDFQVKTASLTTLRVYNMLGQEVAALVNENLAPGSYAVQFSAENLSSGVYLYRLTSGSYTETRRMLLMR